MNKFPPQLISFQIYSHYLITTERQLSEAKSTNNQIGKGILPTQLATLIFLIEICSDFYMNPMFSMCPTIETGCNRDSQPTHFPLSYCVPISMLLRL